MSHARLQLSEVLLHSAHDAASYLNLIREDVSLTSQNMATPSKASIRTMSGVSKFGNAVELKPEELKDRPERSLVIWFMPWLFDCRGQQNPRTQPMQGEHLAPSEQDGVVTPRSGTRTTACGDRVLRTHPPQTKINTLPVWSHVGGRTHTRHTLHTAYLG